MLRVRGVSMTRSRRAGDAVKRALDIALSAIGLVLLAPLLAVLAALVRLTSRGPAIFRHTRVGRGGSEFDVLKLRTMTAAPGHAPGSFDAGDRSRLTRLGRFLRATKLDEFPQLWNVLRGDMSLVGPRPEVRRWVDAYPERWAVVHMVRPGITDPAAIVYRHEEEVLAAAADPEALYRDVVLPHKLTLYEEYVRTRTLAGDLRLLTRTLVALGRSSTPGGPGSAPGSRTRTPARRS
jgi:lipopolysaccharide/colanic/teichoic acid biosynthesis glycosyltransferase